MRKRIVSQSAYKDPIVVAFSGELDVSRFAELRDQLATAWDGSSPMLVDLRQVKLMDSTCLSELLLFRRRVQKVNGAFATIVTDLKVLRLLEITGLRKSLNVSSDYELAHTALRKEGRDLAEPS